MDAVHHRLIYLPATTIGTLTIDGAFECYVQEGRIRPDRVFVPGDSALPPGLYNLSIEESRRFRRRLPLLASTGSLERRRCGDRLGMLIHPGHPEWDYGSEILLGQDQGPKTVARTRLAFEAFMKKVKVARDAGHAINWEIVA